VFSPFALSDKMQKKRTKHAARKPSDDKMEQRLAQYAALRTSYEREEYLNFFWRTYVDRKNAEKDAKEWWTKEHEAFEKEKKRRDRECFQITSVLLFVPAFLLLCVDFSIHLALKEQTLQEDSPSLYHLFSLIHTLLSFSLPILWFCAVFCLACGWCFKS
jgi:hypothetical protein